MIELIIDCLNTYYNLQVSTLTLLLLGADINASTYKAQTHDQTTYFVKVKNGHNHDIGAEVLTLLHKEGIQQIILPVKNCEGHPTQHIDNYTLIVYQFIESQNGFSQNLNDDQWVSLGKILRKVHEIKIPQKFQSRIRKETYSPKWRDFVRSLYGRIEAEPHGDEWAVKLLMFMKEHKEKIYLLVERAELLGNMINQGSAEFVLCHGDIHGGNVLIGANGSIYIIDWDDPVMALKERDLMFIGGGVANVWNNPREEALFYEGYGKTEVNMPILAYYRYERIVEDIAEYAQELLFSSSDRNDREEMYKQFVAMFELRGVVDTAFKTGQGLL